MPKVSKFTKEQKLEIALELLSGKLSHGEVCRRHGISATYAYKLKDRRTAAEAEKGKSKAFSSARSRGPDHAHRERKKTGL